MKNLKIYTISFFIFGLFLFVTPLHYISAATIGFSPSSGSYKVGDTINVKIYISAESKSVNAVAADIKYPSDILSLSSISKTGTIINLWAEEPSFSNVSATASFEGVILNGYTGNSGTTVTLIFRAKAAGTANLSFSSASVLANDGNGTEMLNTKGTSSLKISNAPIVVKPVVKDEGPVAPIDTTIVISEIKNNISQYSPTKFLIQSPQPVADNSYAIQIDSLPSIIWTDDGTHIYQSPALSNGIHVIKAMAVDKNSNALSGFLNFYTTFLKVPVITYYPTELYVDDFLVLKGLADPSVNVELTITNIATGAIILDRVTTNSDGKFIYVPESKMPVGTYSITARSQAVSGITSDYMSPIQIINKERKLNFFVTLFSNYIILLMPFVALIILFILIILYGYYKIKKYNKSLNDKLIKAENIVSKDFENLKRDINKEAIVSSKLKEHEQLTEGEATSLVDFKEDIKKTEQEIIENIESIQKQP